MKFCRGLKARLVHNDGSFSITVVTLSIVSNMSSFLASEKSSFFISLRRFIVDTFHGDSFRGTSDIDSNRDVNVIDCNSCK